MADEYNVLRVNYDDQPNEVVDNTNRILKRYIGLSFVDDVVVHEGFCLYALQEVGKPAVPAEDDILRVSCDDQLNEIVDNVNRILERRVELSFIDDKEPHEGFCLYILQKVSSPVKKQNRHAYIERCAKSQNEEIAYDPWVRPTVGNVSARLTLTGRLFQSALSSLESPKITAQELATTSEVARQLRRIADELDQSGGSLYARVEGPHTSLRDDRQTLVIEPRRNP